MSSVGGAKGLLTPLSPKMTSSPPDQEWSSHLVGACAGPCGWTVDIPRQRRTGGANRYRRFPIKALKEKIHTLLCEFFEQQLVGWCWEANALQCGWRRWWRNCKLLLLLSLSCKCTKLLANCQLPGRDAKMSGIKTHLMSLLMRVGQGEYRYCPQKRDISLGMA